MSENTVMQSKPRLSKINRIHTKHVIAKLHVYEIFFFLMIEIWLKHVSWWTRLAPHVHANYNKMRPSKFYYCFVPQNLLIGHSLVQSDSCNSVISHDLAAIKIVFWPSSITIRCRDCSLIEGILTHPIHPVYQIHQTPDSYSFISCRKLMNRG